MSQTDKISVIRQLLNGSVDPMILRPSQTYLVDYDSQADSYLVDGKTMTATEYQHWKENHFRPDVDILFLTTLDRRKEPETFIHEPVKVKVNEPVKVLEPKQPLKAIKRLFQPTSKKVEPIPQEATETQPKREGKLSEYGLTWSCDPSNIKRELYREPQVYNQKFVVI